MVRDAGGRARGPGTRFRVRNLPGCGPNGGRGRGSAASRGSGPAAAEGGGDLDSLTASGDEVAASAGGAQRATFPQGCLRASGQRELGSGKWDPRTPNLPRPQFPLRNCPVSGSSSTLTTRGRMLSVQLKEAKREQKGFLLTAKLVIV